MSIQDDPTAQGPDPASSLGTRLREARLGADLSLRAVARQLGVSASFVSQLENGKSQPSVATLYSLSRLLDVSMDTLFGRAGDPSPPAPAPASAGEPDVPALAAAGGAPAGDTEATPVSRVDLRSPAAAWDEAPRAASHKSLTTQGTRTRLLLECGVVWEQLAHKTDDLDFMEIFYPPGSSSTTDGRMLRHDDYEYGYLLEGELEVTLGFDVFTLHATEAIGFDSTVPHLFRNLGATPARGIWVVHHRRP